MYSKMGEANQCESTHNIAALSFFTATVCAILMVTTVAFNFVILFAIAKNRSKSFKPVFFRAIFNISLSDLLTGLIVDSLCFNYVLKEGLGYSLTSAEKKLSHLSFFIFSGVAVVTMGLLSVERLWALLKPFNHLKGLKMWQSSSILSGTWAGVILISLIYLRVGFIACLVVFACSTVVFSFILMIITLIVYKRRMHKNSKKRGRYSISRSDSTAKSTKRFSIKDSLSQAGERRVTKTFLLMLVVFLLSYFPTIIMIIYMNNCVNCNCVLIHSMRDLTFLFVVAGALMRPINFICRLRVLRKSIMKIICGRNHENPKNSEVSIKLRSSTEKQ